VTVIAAATLGLLLALVLFAPPRWALTALIAGVLYMTNGQSINLIGLNIYPMRILTLAAFLRVLVRREWSWSELNGIDKALLVAYGYRTAIFVLNSNGPAISALALMIDVTLSYFACRGLLNSFGDLEWFLRALMVLLVPYVALLAIESATGHNPFVIIGGLDELVVRHGRPRCIGSFGHASILGTFGASFLPLFIALWLIGTRRLCGILGTVLCFAIVLFSNSGGPLTCAMLALVGWLFWFFRTKMHAVRVSIMTILIACGLTMQAPIWYLPARISTITGGDGWHRSYLMDIAFRQFDRWWFAGMPVIETRDWFPYRVASGAADLINYYLDFGIAAGFAGTVLFLFLLVRAFSSLGRALGAARATPTASRSVELMLWALGVVLVIHVNNWFGMVYFDQYYVVFFMQLAILSTLSHQYIHACVDRYECTTPVSIEHHRI
jgi:hypothetical protein